MACIVLDAMGSDNYPHPDVEGAILAAQKYDVEIILVGDEAIIKPLLTTVDTEALSISIVHAPNMLTANDKGMNLVLKARRPNSQNSIAVGIDLVKNGKADAFVTVGNTGAAMVTAYFRLGTIPGVDLPALAPIIPTATGSCVILDVGANTDVKPKNLLQFGIMGSIYSEKVCGVKNPKIGLISNGEEEGKGNQLVRDASLLFKDSNLNYFGNIEGKELAGGSVDVAVTDGFVGNVILKIYEAVAKLILETITKAIKSGGLVAMLGGLLARPALRKVKVLLNPSEYGAAPLLGANGLVFIGHGRSDANAITNAIRVAKEAIESDVIGSIKVAIEENLKT